MNLPATAVSLFLLTTPAFVPPLTDGQRTRLETAYDGRDHREEAFVALVENALAFTGRGADVAGSAPVRLEPDLDALLSDPDGHRGDLCRITGVLQQSTRLERPHAGAWEWFVRDDAGRAILVYVAAAAPEDLEPFRVNRRVSVYARFYKRVDAVARDGTTRSYAAFVGAQPWLETRAAGSPGLPVVFALMVVLLLGLVLVFVLLNVLTRRQRRARRPRLAGGFGGSARGDDEAELDDDRPLPDDPSEALAELRRRAETQD